MSSQLLLDLQVSLLILLARISLQLKARHRACGSKVQNEKLSETPPKQQTYSAPWLCFWQTLRSCVPVRGRTCQRASCLGPTVHCYRERRLLRREPVAPRRLWPEPWRTCTNSSQCLFCIFRFV